MAAGGSAGPRRHLALDRGGGAREPGRGGPAFGGGGGFGCERGWGFNAWGCCLASRPSIDRSIGPSIDWGIGPDSDRIGSDRLPAHHTLHPYNTPGRRRSRRSRWWPSGRRWRGAVVAGLRGGVCPHVAGCVAGLLGGERPITLDCGGRHAFHHGCIQRLARAVQAAGRTPQLPVVPGPVLGRWSDGVDGVLILSWDGLDDGALSSIDGTRTGFARVRCMYTCYLSSHLMYKGIIQFIKDGSVTLWFFSFVSHRSAPNPHSGFVLFCVNVSTQGPVGAGVGMTPHILPHRRLPLPDARGPCPRVFFIAQFSSHNMILSFPLLRSCFHLPVMWNPSLYVGGILTSQFSVFPKRRRPSPHAHTPGVLSSAPHSPALFPPKAPTVLFSSHDTI